MYQNDETINSTGWVTFTFSTPFSFNGTQNLMIDFSYNNSSWSDGGFCRYSTTALSRSIFFQTDSNYGDPLTWSGTSSPSPDRNINLPNVRLALAGNQVAISPTASGNFSGGVWAGQMTVLEGATGMYLRAEDGSGAAGNSNTFDVQQSQQTHTLTVQSSPVTGVSIAGDKPGTTNYTVTCDDQEVVNLSAPAMVTVGAVRYDFVQWTGGTPAGQNVQATMDGDKALTAEYALRRHTLTVQSSPVTGVSIAGDKPGTTNYTATCDDQEVVNLSAPLNATVADVEYIFDFWVVGGADQPPRQVGLQTTMDAAHVAHARYSLAGDANGDCTVNILDLIAVRNHVQQPVATDDNWRSDFNNDGLINVLDVIIVRNRLRATCP